MAQVWSVDILGGFAYSDELSDTLRTDLQPVVRFRQLCDAADAMDKGLNAGEFYNWNVYSDVGRRGRALDEQLEMPTTNFQIRQGQLRIGEMGNSVKYTGKLNNLSKQPITEIIRKVLKHDAKKALDAAAHAQFDLTPLTVAPTSGNSATAVTFQTTGCDITNGIAMRAAHIKAISDGMKERNIPAFAGDDYYALSWPTTTRAFKNDYEALKQYHGEGFGYIMNGETGRYEGIRFGEQTLIPKGGAVDSTTWSSEDGVADAWNGGVSDWAFFMGEDTVMEAVAIPEEIRGKLPGDFGRSRGVAWYYLGGFGIVHGSASDAKNIRIVKWESAA